jgi:hypothetical protein
MDEIAQLRGDIEELRRLIAAILDRYGDIGLLSACADVLRERRERLEELERQAGRTS